MKRLALILTIIFVALFTSKPAFAQHYYSDGAQLPLKVDSAKICLKFEQ